MPQFVTIPINCIKGASIINHMKIEIAKDKNSAQVISEIEITLTQLSTCHKISSLQVQQYHHLWIQLSLAQVISEIEIALTQLSTCHKIIYICSSDLPQLRRLCGPRGGRQRLAHVI